MKQSKYLLLFAFLMTLISGVSYQDGQNDFQKGVRAFENGQYEPAVTAFQAALTAFTKSNNKPGMADAYNYLGLVYQLLNQHENAEKNFKAAVPLFLETGNKSGAASGLANWGISMFRVREEAAKKAGQKLSGDDVAPVLAFHLKAKQFHEALNDQTGVASDLTNIANMYFEADILSEAAQYYSEAYKLNESIGAKGGMAYTIANLARLSMRTSDQDRALKYYLRSADLFGEIGDREGLWRTYNFIGTIYIAKMKEAMILGDGAKAAEYRTNAIDALKQSVYYIETLRGGFTNKEFFASFLQDKNPVYKKLIKLLKESGNAAEALSYIERSKSKMSNDVIQAGKIELTDKAEQAKFDKVQKLQEQNDDLQNQLAEEKAKPAEKQDKAKIDQLSSTLTKNEGDFNALMIDLETKYPNMYQVVKIDPIQLTDLQKQLSDDMVILEYFPADDALYIFMITRDKIEAKSVPVSAATIDSLVNKFRYYISDVTSLLKRGRFDTKMKNWTKAGAGDSRFYDRHTKPLMDIMVQLHDYLILPVWDEIKGDKTSTVTIIPAGSLYYIPFQCLATETQDGDIRFLIEKKAVNYLTAATLMDLVSKKKPKPITNVLVFGNPDGSLPGAEEEAKVIKSAFANAILYKNLEATKDRAREQSGKTDVVHFATHGFLSSEEPQKSFLLMAPNEVKNEDNKLTISEILRLPLKEKNNLVVLSACNTSMGKSATGVELISLSRAFAIAGAPTTVATLWPVDDESTKIIMINFYDGLKKGLTKAEALRRAQVALLNKGDFHIHPFFWAPYVMIGNAK